MIFSDSWEEHLTHLHSVLTRLREACLTTKGKKCKFGANQCNLGHVVGGGLVQPLESKTLAVDSFKVPETKKEVCIFLE